MPAGDDTTELDRRLAEVDALRKRVLNVIPHALRTPITTFRGLAEALGQASDKEIREEIGPALRRLAAQAERLLDDLLIASGYSTALPTGAPHGMPVVATLRSVWSEVGGDRRFEVSGSEDVAVMAPGGSLEKMLVHVLDNAAKYGADPVRADLSEAAGRVTITVSSAGAVPADVAQFVEPFYRGEGAVMRSSGLGVGLTVAAALATQAGGSLEVRAAPEGGGLLTCIELATAGSST